MRLAQFFPKYPPVKTVTPQPYYISAAYDFWCVFALGSLALITFLAFLYYRLTHCSENLRSEGTNLTRQPVGPSV